MIKLFKYLFSPSYLYGELKRSRILSQYKDKELTMGFNVSLHRCELGHYVHLGNNVSVEKSSIGNHSYVNSHSRIRFTKIGKFCSIGPNVKIGLGIHPTNLVSTHPAFYSKDKDFRTFSDKTLYEDYKSTMIGNDVWIGENSIVMGGIQIEDGAIIAAGAVVTKNVGAYEIVGGVPAKHIKYRFEEGICDKIQKTNWWNRDEQWFVENYKIFLSTEEFLSHFEEF